MTNLTITNVDTSRVVTLSDLASWDDELLVFSGAGTELTGTLLARKAVADAIVVTADVGNTGDGTCTVASVVAGTVVPLVGDYNLECIEAVANGGIFKLEDPNGGIVSAYLPMTPGAGGATVFEVAGMTFTLTDGATDFIVGDKFALAVAADGKIYPYAIAGIGGVQNPIGLLTSAVTATGAGNVAIRMFKHGKVRSDKLVISADGDGSNITAAILDQLRSAGVDSSPVTELLDYDNQ